MRRGALVRGARGPGLRSVPRAGGGAMKPLDPFDIPLAGTQLVEASAGTGKTYTITTLFLRLLLEAQFDVDEILVVTFTNAATAEQRVLKHHAFESGVRFDAELAGDDSTRLAELVEDFWTTRVGTIELAILEHLVTRKRQKKSPIGLGELHALARTAVEHSDAVPLPGEVELCLDGVRLLDQELAGWASAWRDQGDEVRRLLLEHEGLNRNSYREETLLCCFAEMDELADRAATGTVDLIEGFDRFTTTALRKGTKKNHEPPEHRFFEVCDLVAQAHEPVRQALPLLPLKLRLELVDAARREHPRRKAAQGVMSYSSGRCTAGRPPPSS
ncbi:MAG: UvrD-helicase domain-containing protein [Candidatus Riflebacteria bacterium]|nr:UvrD-helicase domain-containing protein [Candidatus Riflebacteria bacterium]